jgi:stress-induced morphogen
VGWTALLFLPVSRAHSVVFCNDCGTPVRFFVTDPGSTAMQLPKYKKKKRIKLKVCQEPGCGREFWGHPIAKYCDLHRDIKQRAKHKKEFESVEVKNMVFKHNYTEVLDLEFLCCLDGCNQRYTVKVFPKQFVYPRYCMEHRNDFRRANFMRMQKVKAMAARR